MAELAAPCFVTVNNGSRSITAGLQVCAINDTWGGLRFVVRMENRPYWSGPVEI